MKALYNREWDLPFDKILASLNDAKVDAATTFVEDRKKIEIKIKENL
jgi:hypothetical protein